MIRPPKTGTEYRLHRGRLALFHEAEDQGGYWTDYWSENSPEQYRESGLALALEAGEVFVDRIDRSRPVLDAGCGLGRAVGSLTLRGYDVLGIDYEDEVVRRARLVYPEARIEQGDVLDLDLDDASIGCYVSLGIVEHFEDGPGQALREARRVLEPGGLAIIEVPHLNPARARLRRHLEARVIDAGGDDLHFHQYYFGPGDVVDELHQAGFRVVGRQYGSVQGFLLREVGPLADGWPHLPERVRRVLRPLFGRLPTVAGERWAHMMTYLAEADG